MRIYYFKRKNNRNFSICYQKDYKDFLVLNLNFDHLIILYRNLNKTYATTAKKIDKIIYEIILYISFL